MIRDLVPAARRVAVLWDSNSANARAEAHAALEAAARLGLKGEKLALPSDGDLPHALGRLLANKPDALYVTFEEGIVVNNRSVIAEFGVRHRVPMISGWSSLTEAGGLISYAPDLAAIFRRFAHYVDRILKGTKPAELPVELARSVELVINLKTAAALGLKIPQLTNFLASLRQEELKALQKAGQDPSKAPPPELLALPPLVPDVGPLRDPGDDRPRPSRPP